MTATARFACADDRNLDDTVLCVTTYFHGTSAALSPGDVLKAGTLGDDTPADRDPSEMWVWATTDLAEAMGWASLRGWRQMWNDRSPAVHVYEVELREPVVEDLNMRGSTTSVMAKAGTVVRQVASFESPDEVETAIRASRER